MTQLNTEGSEVPAYNHIDPIKRDTSEEVGSTNPSTNPKVDCLTHGPSQVPLVDRELQNPQAKEIIHTLTAALTDLVDEKKCTKCTVENMSTYLTGLVRDLRVAKQEGRWSKEDKKALKAEVKSLFKPVKKDVKSLWKSA